MQEQLITFETAKLAKEKGFNILDNKQVKMAYVDVRNNGIIYFDYFTINSNGVIESDRCGTNSSNFEGLRRSYITKDIPKEIKYEWYLRPTQSLLHKWLREIHKIHVNIHSYSIIINKKEVYFHIVSVGDYKEEFKDYEEALEIGLQEGLKLILK